MSKVVVLGAGIMGLAAAHRALTLGHEVTLLEAASEPGGMAAHFNFDGLSIERFYHFVCKSDTPTFELLAELDMRDAMRWRSTSMGYFVEGALHKWGDPFALLRFPHLNLIEKFRYGLLMLISTRRNAWPALEHVSTRAWIEAWCGKTVYAKLWKRLLDLKFHEYADDISAQWTWARIRRVGRSRKSLLQEELGYIEGGSQTLVDALIAAIAKSGGTVKLKEPADRVLITDGKVTGVRTTNGDYRADAVVSTVPTPLLGSLLAEAPDGLRTRYDAIQNIGVVCVVLKLRRSVTPHFWVNIVDPALPIPGIIEFTNLRPAPTGETVVYVPYYMPLQNPAWQRTNDEFVDEVLAAIRAINPAVQRGDLIATYVGRLKHAQPVCPPGFKAQLPPVRTEVRGLQIADTCFYYPEDRGVAESVRLGREMVEHLSA